MYSLAHARVNSQAKAFMSAWTAVIPNSCGMFLIVMQWISHCVQWQIDSVGVFVWAPAPFCGFCFVSAVCFAVSAGETQVWLGDLRVVVFGLVVVFCFCCFNRFADSKGPLSLQFVFPAYFHVRTEPLARHRPHSRKKNRRLPGPVFRFAPLLLLCPPAEV